MKFCSLCNNMMYIRSTSHETAYLCKMCQNEEPLVAQTDSGDPLVITDTLLHDDDMKYRRYLSPYLIDDVTIPHVSNIICPNDSCVRSEQNANDVIVVKYDNDKLKFMYMCAYCKHYWLN